MAQSNCDIRHSWQNLTLEGNAFESRACTTSVIEATLTWTMFLNDDGSLCFAIAPNIICVTGGKIGIEGILNWSMKRANQ